MINLIVVEWNG